VLLEEAAIAERVLERVRKDIHWRVHDARQPRVGGVRDRGRYRAGLPAEHLP
jgi:hypothetical protein